MNWTAVIITLLFGLAMWFVPNPIVEKKPVPPVLPAPVIITYRDTVFVPQPPVKGKDTSKIEFSYAEPPDIMEFTTDSTTKDAHIVFRSTTYLDRLGPGWNHFTIHEWNVQCKPCQEIVKVDTVKIPYPVEIPVPEVAQFYESPYFVAPVAALLTYLIVNALKKD